MTLKNVGVVKMDMHFLMTEKNANLLRVVNNWRKATTNVLVVSNITIKILKGNAKELYVYIMMTMMFVPFVLMDIILTKIKSAKK